MDTSAPTRDGLPGNALPEGTMVGEYLVTGWLGQGGMGIVHSGVHPVLEKHVAIKVLDRVDDVERFVREAQVVNRIGHPNIVDIFAFGRLPDGRPYLVMEFLQGRTLANLVKASAPVACATALPILIGIGEALRAAHEHGVIHRDLKPDNVFLLEQPGRPPRVKVIDFGIAKVRPSDGHETTKTRTGTIFGTPQYMSPEQARGVGRIDHRTDVYAFGVIAYRMLTGRLPFAGESPVDVVYQQMHAQPLPPSWAGGVPRPLEMIILRALAKNPADRYADFAELLAELGALPPEVLAWTPAHRFEKPGGDLATAPPPQAATGRPRRRIGAIAIVLVAGAVALGGATWARRHARPAEAKMAPRLTPARAPSVPATPTTEGAAKPTPATATRPPPRLVHKPAKPLLGPNGFAPDW